MLPSLLILVITAAGVALCSTYARSSDNDNDSPPVSHPDAEAEASKRTKTTLK